jgi:hypothetical protein
MLTRRRLLRRFLAYVWPYYGLIAWIGGLLGSFWASPEGAFHLKGRTSIVLAHRLSTIFAADRIIVLNDGRIVQIGSHAGLSRRDGLYARLYEAQRLVPEDDVAKAGAA